YDSAAAREARSDLEAAFLDLVREAGLPPPSVNVLVAGYLVDAYWPAARLVVELQSYEHHAHRQAFDRDYAKLGRLTCPASGCFRSRRDSFGTSRTGSWAP